MGFYKEIDLIFKNSDEPVGDVAEMLQTKGVPEPERKARELLSRWITLNDKGDYTMDKFWETDTFTLFADWYMRDMEKRSYDWQQIAIQMKGLAITPHKYRKEWERYHNEMDELESQVNNNPDDGSWVGR